MVLNLEWEPLLAFLSWFDKHSFLGIPADIPAHFVVSVLAYLGLRWVGAGERAAILGVAGLCLFKEFVVDLRPLLYNHEWGEPIKDLVVGFSGLGAAVAWRRRLQSGARPS